MRGEFLSVLPILLSHRFNWRLASVMELLWCYMVAMLAERNLKLLVDNLSCWPEEPCGKGPCGPSVCEIPLLLSSWYMCPEDGSSLMNLCKMQKDEMLRGTDIFRLEESEIKGCWKQEWGKYQRLLCQAVNVKHICKVPWPSLWELKCDISCKSQINPYTNHMQIRPKETEKFENLIDNGIIGKKASKAHGVSLIGFSAWYKYTTLSRRF